MAAGFDGDLDLGADAVIGGDQDRVLEPGPFKVKQPAKTADFGVGARPRGGADQRLDQVHHPVAGIDIHASLRVSEAALFFCHDGSI